MMLVYHLVKVPFHLPEGTMGIFIFNGGREFIFFNILYFLIRPAMLVERNYGKLLYQICKWFFLVVFLLLIVYGLLVTKSATRIMKAIFDANFNDWLKMMAVVLGAVAFYALFCLVVWALAPKYQKWISNPDLEESQQV